MKQLTIAPSSYLAYQLPNNLPARFYLPNTCSRRKRISVGTIMILMRL